MIEEKNAYHRIFANARWSIDQVGLAVFDLIVKLTNQDTYYLVGDDTLIHKTGLKVYGAGMHRDALAGTAINLTGSSYSANELEAFTTDVIVTTFDASVALPLLDETLNQLRIPDHGLIEGTTVVYRTGSGAPIGGLTANELYTIGRFRRQAKFNNEGQTDFEEEDSNDVTSSENVLRGTGGEINNVFSVAGAISYTTMF